MHGHLGQVWQVAEQEVGRVPAGVLVWSLSALYHCDPLHSWRNLPQSSTHHTRRIRGLALERLDGSSAVPQSLYQVLEPPESPLEQALLLCLFPKWRHSCSLP